VPDAGTAARYFRGKLQQWALSDGSALHHVDRVGRGGLAQEFRSDPNFDAVYQFVRLAGRYSVRSNAIHSAETYLSDLFQYPLAPAIDTVLDAVADACGNGSEADRWTTASATAIVLTAAAIAFSGLVGPVVRDGSQRESPGGAEARKETFGTV